MRIRPTMPGLFIEPWAYFANKGLNKPIIQNAARKISSFFSWITAVSDIDLNLPPGLYFISLRPNRSRPATESDFSD